ncbi:ribosome maturation factor RimM [Andreprevotia chitinilytica]|uniref:ribosome maturation factor RimM n=1 Tax=Andreprevotia chitinilytica TaxID=396808 RepID=UPI00068BD937|nr:ribosome maturation factor RimM [Andreprevotia chitinilytica]
MGFVSGAFGIRGWVHIVPDTEFADSLLDYDTWWLGRNGVWQAYKVLESVVQPKKLAARLEGIDDRDVAFSFKGMQVAVPRSQMPELDNDNEFYWADLIGLTVVNTQGETLGVVEKLFETGANDVLVVNDGETERLLPFVAHVVLAVDRDAKRITVDWGLDY